MSTLVKSGSIAEGRRIPIPTSHWLAAGVAGLVWILLFVRLNVDWTTNPQYNYGLMVPVLALALLWKRWGIRPAPARSGRLMVAAIGTGALLLLWLPIRLVEEANPEWRLVLWVHALAAVALTLLAAYSFGGRPWLRHFAFPIGFLLIAVPWPTGLEQTVIQNLMRFVAMITVELLDVMNIPAVQHGNIIEISRGVVGVDEACSGVRSLQTTLLVCLFLGEFYRFTWLKRGWLLAGGILLAVVANIGRTLFLVWAVSAHGFDSMHAWHDAAGITVLVVVMVGVWILALRLRTTQTEPAPTASETTPRDLPRSLLAGVACWLLLVEGAVEWWYRAHESDLVKAVQWSVAWPEQQSGFSNLEIGETALGVLRCDEARGAGWRDARGYQWKLNLLRWEPGRNSAQLAKSHRPEICLPGAGLQLSADLGVVPVSVTDFDLPVSRYVFTQQGRVLHVFYSIWEDRVPTRHRVLVEDGSMASRFAAVAAGKRHLGQQVLQIAILGPTTAEEALGVLRSEIKTLIRKSSNSGS
jgi:exosortase